MLHIPTKIFSFFEKNSKIQGLKKIGGTPGRSSLHTGASRHTG